jgi:zinc transporter ZupT
MVFLAASLAMLSLGPLLYRAVERRAAAVALLDVGAVIAVGVLVLFFIVPESVEHEGWLALAMLLVGLLLPTLIERAVKRIAAQAHRAVLTVVVAGLGVHQLLDGVALALPGGDHVHALPAAVVLHQLPAGIVIWRLLRATRGPRASAAVMAMLGLAIVVGYVAGEQLHGIEVPGLGLFTALVAGSLLHVFVHTWDSHSHEH